jgi:hypothetical protein
MINMKKQAFNAAAILALTASAASHSALLVPNGDFESNFDSWGYEFGGGGSYTVEATGGNTGGYLQMGQASVWGSVAISTDNPVGGTLAEFGLTGETTANMQWDQKVISGAGGGMGIKIESWNETAVISDSGDQVFTNTGSGWETFSYNYTIAPGATRLKVVLLGLNTDSVMGYDNVTALNGTAAVPVPAAAWLFGSALAGLVAVRRKK